MSVKGHWEGGRRARFKQAKVRGLQRRLRLRLRVCLEAPLLQATQMEVMPASSHIRPRLGWLRGKGKQAEGRKSRMESPL